MLHYKLYGMGLTPIRITLYGFVWYLSVNKYYIFIVRRSFEFQIHIYDKLFA